MKDHKIKKQKQEHVRRLCDEPRCKFRGKPVVQGVCFSSKGELVDWKRIEEIEKREEAEFRSFKRRYRGKKYVSWLEAHYTCAMLNWQFTLDEVIRLRRDNALLRRKQGR